MSRTKRIVSVVLACVSMVFCFLLASCNAKKAGTYKFESISYVESGMTIELKVGESYMGMITLTEDYFTVILNDGGTASMSVMSGMQKSTGEWSESEESGKINLTFDGETQICSCDGSRLTIESDGNKIVLKK